MSYIVLPLRTPGLKDVEWSWKESKSNSGTGLVKIRLSAHLQFSINAPEPGTQKAFKVITKKINEKWLAAKPDHKLLKKVISVLVKDKCVQADMPEVGN